VLYEIDYEYDKKLLAQECDDREGYEPFVDPKTGTVIDKWLIKRNVTGYGKIITEEFEKRLGVSIRPRFYIQEKGFTLPFHQDRGTQCCINFVLSTTRDPIVFRHSYNTFKFQYEKALVNVQEEHMVEASREDRYLFKLSIFDISYDEALETMTEHNLLRLSKP